MATYELQRIYGKNDGPCPHRESADKAFYESDLVQNALVAARLRFAKQKAARNTAETRSRVCAIGNKLAKDMGREAAFVKAWAMVKGGAVTLPVKGVTFGNRQEALRRLAAYQPSVIRAWFAPEPENKADPNAVAVMVMVQGGRGAYRLGYLPRQETAAVQALGAKLPRLRVLPGDVYGARVTVAV